MSTKFIKSPMLSVIIPVYNSESTLRQCVDSLLHQTYSRFELLLINDGSSDLSPVICDEYAQTDVRVKVFHKVNGGVSSARNLGLKNANGDYITFVDSDDWVEPTYLEDFFPLNSIDFASNYFIAEGWPEWESCPIQNKQYDNENMIEFLSGDFTRMNFMCSKLFKRDIINNNKIRFLNDISYGEDVLFVYTYILHANVIKTKGNPVYHYNCQGLGSLSLSHNIVPWCKYEFAINKLCEIINCLEQKYNWDGYDARNIVVRNHFNKFVREIQWAYKIKDGVNALKLSTKNQYVMQQIRDTRTYKKSLSRRILDWLLIYRMYFLCVLIMKITFKR